MPLWVAAGVIWVAWWLLLLFMPIRLRLRARAASAGGRGWAEADVAWLLLRRRWRWSVNLGEWLIRPLTRRGRGRSQRGPGAGAGRVWWPAVTYLASRLRVRRLSLDLAVGTGDSLQTAMACGAAWSLAGVLLGALSARVRLRPGSVQVNVMPEFGPAGLQAEAYCTASLRAFYLLPAMGIVLRHGGLGLLRRRSRAHRPARRESEVSFD